MFLNRDQIVAQRWPSEEVLLPEFGEGSKVLVKTLSAAEFFQMAELEKAHVGRGYALWWITTVCDADGRAIFTIDDIEFLTTLPIGTLNKVVEAAKRVNKIADAKETDSPNV